MVESYNKLLQERHKLVGELRSKLIKEIGSCEHCGYSEFLEVLEIAHITHGHESDKHTRKNVFLLCPTCHRCFDRGFIEVKGEVSDCHLVNYRSNFVLIKATDKIKKLQKKNINGGKKWKSNGDGKFYLV